MTDAAVVFPERAVWTRFGTVRVPDRTLVQARIGGDESDAAGTVRHSLFDLEAPLARADDALDWCVDRLPAPPPPPPPAPVETAKPAEANAF